MNQIDFEDLASGLHTTMENSSKFNGLALVEMLATIGTIIGLYFLSENNSLGFAIGGISNVLWIYWSHEKNSLGLIITNILLVFINLNGLNVL